MDEAEDMVARHGQQWPKGQGMEYDKGNILNYVLCDPFLEEFVEYIGFFACSRESGSTKCHPVG